jgi:hypothetical protein
VVVWMVLIGYPGTDTFYFIKTNAAKNEKI